MSADFDLHGLVGIRVLGGNPADRAVVAAQLGPIARPFSRDPDIVIRFVDRLETKSPLQLLGTGDCAFADDTFLILRSRHKTPAKVRIAFDTIGGRCEITCERGLPAVPLLLPIINLTVLARGGVALHASAFRYRGTGTLVTGWCKGGKTELLLGFIERGAEYIGDEWIYLAKDGSRMFGIPQPIRVWDWHLSQLPRYRHQAGRPTRARLAALRQGHRLATAITHGPMSRRAAWLRRCRPIADLIDRQRYAFLRPENAFGSPLGTLASKIDQVIFVGSSTQGRTYLTPVPPAWVADRMVFSLDEERSMLAAYYRRFRFAFPDRASWLIDNAARLERERLHDLLEGRPCFALYHPYPPSIDELSATAAPLFPAD